MKHYTKTHYNESTLCTTESFEGLSIEEKVRIATETKAPIEAVSPMVYTERKEGVRTDTNIRTDKWDVAQQAMTSIADGIRTKRSERMNAETAKPDANSKTSAQNDI